MTIQQILLKYPPARENLLRVIKEINKETGCFDNEAARKVADYFELSPAAVYSAASFYDEVHKNKINLHIQVCDGPNCLLKGADQIIQEIETFLGVRAGDDNNRNVRIEKMSCNGNCLVGPVVIINDTIFERVEPGLIISILQSYL